MSGRPLRNASDKERVRNEYMESLQQRIDLDDKVLQAVKTYKLNGTLPAVSQIADNRTTAEKLLDIIGIKNGIIKDFATIMKSNVASSLVEGLEKSPLNIDNRLINFTAQRAPEIAIALQKMYKYGIKGDSNDIYTFVQYINSMFSNKNNSTSSLKQLVDSGYTSSRGVVSGDDLRKYFEEDMIKIFSNLSRSKIGDKSIGLLENIRRKSGALVSYLPSSQTIIDANKYLFSNIVTDDSDTQRTIIEILSWIKDNLPNKDYLFSLTKFILYNIADSERQHKPLSVQVIIDYLSKIDELIPEVPRLPKLDSLLHIIAYPPNPPSNPFAGTHSIPNPTTSQIPSNASIPFVSNNPPDPNNPSNPFAGTHSIPNPTTPSLFPNNISSPDLPPVTPSRVTIHERPTNFNDLDPLLRQNQNEPIDRRMSDSGSNIGIDEYLNDYPDEENQQTGEHYNRSNQNVSPINSDDELDEEKENENMGEFLKQQEDDLNRERNMLIMNIQKINEALKNRMLTLEKQDHLLNEHGIALARFNEIEDELRYLHSRQSSYGNGLHKKKRRGRPKGKGISIPISENIEKIGISPTLKYSNFGKYLLHNGKLRDNVISMKTGKGISVVGYPSTKVSKVFSKVVKTILGGGLPSFDDMSKLSEEEKNYLHKLSTKSNIVDKLNIPTPSKDQEEKDLHQFEVQKGEIMSGNDSKDLIKSFKILLLKLSKNGTLPKNQVNEIMSDILALGY